MKAQLSFVHALSPLHAGTGQGAGVIDLPIAREKATGLPFLPGSSLKGALGTRSLNKGEKDISKLIFGPRDLLDEKDNRASLAQFSDQKLLLLPIRSLAGTFAWVTSPYVLRRFLRDLRDTGVTPPTANVPDIASADQCLISNEKQNALVLTIDNAKKVCLEDLDFTAKADNQAQIWATWIAEHIFSDQDDWQTMLRQRFCIVHDDVLSFLLNTATEITARIRLKEDTKTVVDGALWYEESLPTETILAGVVIATPSNVAEMPVKRIFKELAALTEQTIQLGGNATVGRGLCRIKLVGGEA